MALQLGLIPSWQFSDDPAENPLVTNMQYPPGATQLTPQPYGTWMNGDPGVTCTSRLGGCAHNRALAGNPFNSWWWTNRRWVALAGVGLIGAALATLTAAVIR